MVNLCIERLDFTLRTTRSPPSRSHTLEQDRPKQLPSWVSEEPQSEPQNKLRIKRNLIKLPIITELYSLIPECSLHSCSTCMYFASRAIYY